MPIDFFKKTKLPDNIPAELATFINTLKSSKDQADCIRRAYDIVSARFHGLHLVTYFKIHKIFNSDIGDLWNQTGFMHCTNINYLMRFLLVKSGFFEEDNVRLKWTTYIFLSPHQYIQVEVGDELISIDIWAKKFGIRFGDYLHGFHNRSR